MTLEIAQPLIPFRLKNVDEQTLSPEAFTSAKALAVIFWCNHCPYVRAWEDRVIGLQREYADRGVQILLVNSNDAQKYPGDSFEQMQLRARERDYPFPYLVDDTQDVARQYGASRTPEIFLFDEARALRYHGAPDDNVDDPKEVVHRYLRDAIEAVLAGTTPTPSEIPPKGCTIKWR